MILCKVVSVKARVVVVFAFSWFVMWGYLVFVVQRFCQDLCGYTD